MKRLTRKLTLLASLLLIPSLTLALESIPLTNFGGGLNNKVSSTEIASNEARDIKNINLSYAIGQINKRTGYVSVSTHTVYGAYAITGGFDYANGVGTQYLLACSTSTIRKYNSSTAGHWDIITPSSTVSITSTDYYDFEVFVDTCVIVGGQNVPQKYYGGSLTYDIDTGTDPDDHRPNYAQYVERFKNRLWFGGKMQEADAGVAGSLTYNRVRYSGDYGAPNIFEGADAWPENWYFNIDDELITGMKTFRDSLIVFGLHSINAIRGEMYAATNAFTLTKLTNSVGCISNRTIVPVDNDLYFMAPSGHIYSYDGSSVQLRSDKISTTINALNKLYIQYSVACYFPKYHQLWVSCPTSSATTNDQVLVYDTLYDTWSIYSGIEASVLFLREVNNEYQLYSGSAAYGYLSRQDSGDIDYPNNTATDIDAYYSTKYFSTDMKERDNIFDSIFVTVEQSGDYDLKVKAITDYGKYQTEYLIPLTPGGSLWDQAVWDVDTWAGEDTVLIKKLGLNRAGSFISLTFGTAYQSQPFTIFGARILFNPQEMR